MVYHLGASIIWYITAYWDYYAFFNHGGHPISNMNSLLLFFTHECTIWRINDS